MANAERELEDMLRRGIAAAKAGQLEMARDLLMRIVERDERNVTAWLWLSGVMTSPDDRQICLENVLAIDPNNQVARKGLAMLRQETAEPSKPRLPPKKTGFTTGGASAPTLASAILNEPPLPAVGAPEKQGPEPAAYTPPSIEEGYTFSTRASPTLAAALLRKTPDQPQPDADQEAFSPLTPPLSDYPAVPGWSEPMQDMQTLLSEFDNEELCPYCAEATAPEDKTCPACKGQLWEKTKKPLPPPSCLLWVLITFQLGSGLVQMGMLTIGLGALFGNMFSEGTLTLGQFIWLYLGIDSLPSGVGSQILEQMPRMSFWVSLISAGLPIILAGLLYIRWRPIYWFLVVTSLGYLLITIILALSAGFGVATIIPLAIAIVNVIGVLSIQRDFIASSQNQRIWCRPDKDIKTHSGFYMRGREYAQRKMWAMAVLHYQRAVANAPSMVAYHTELAGAYVKLKRYERAQSVLREAQRIAPDNQDVRKLLDMVTEERARYRGV